MRKTKRLRQGLNTTGSVPTSRKGRSNCRGTGLRDVRSSVRLTVSVAGEVAYAGWESVRVECCCCAADPVGAGASRYREAVDSVVVAPDFFGAFPLI